jgi:excisionase family DNA binding protein
MALMERTVMTGTLLSLRDVSQKLGISERTVYRLMDDGELHPFKMGKSWKFEMSDIEAYIDRLRKTATKQPKAED